MQFKSMTRSFELLGQGLASTSHICDVAPLCLDMAFLSSCGGKGVTYKQKCPSCGGVGIVADNKALKCVIEPGMVQGDELKFEHEADVQNPDIDPGDLIFVLGVDESRSKFDRMQSDPNHLEITDHVTLKEALLGFEHEIVHMDNHRVKIKHSGITAPYQVRRVQGEGMPIRKRKSGATHGDLFVEQRVRFPSSVTPALGAARLPAALARRRQAAGLALRQRGV